jgi:hypothetical protein
MTAVFLRTPPSLNSVLALQAGSNVSYPNSKVTETEEYILAWSISGDDEPNAEPLQIIDFQEFQASKCYLLLIFTVVPQQYSSVQSDFSFDNYKRWRESWNSNGTFHKSSTNLNFPTYQINVQTVLWYGKTTSFFAKALASALECKVEQKISNGSLVEVLVQQNCQNTEKISIDSLFSKDDSTTNIVDSSSLYASWSPAELVRHFDSVCSPIEDWIFLGGKQ